MADRVALSLAYEPPEACARAFLASDAPVRALLGEIVGGRGVVAAKAAFALALKPPRGCRWLAAAPNRDTLTDQTVRDFLSSLPGGAQWDAKGQFVGLGAWDATARRYLLQAHVKGVDKDVQFRFLDLRSADDRRRLDDEGTAGVWFDDARGIDAQTVAAAMRGGRPVLITSAMPPADHWLATAPGLARFHRADAQYLPSAPPGTLEALIHASYDLPDAA